MYLSKKFVQLRLRNKLMVWINPMSVNIKVGTSEPNLIRYNAWLDKLKTQYRVRGFIRKPISQCFTLIDSFLINSENYQPLTLIAENRKYHKVKDMVEKRKDFQNSIWFQDLLVELEMNGQATHKKITMHSPEEVEAFMSSYVVELINSLINEGFNLDKAGDVGTALIGADGSIHKSKAGEHRFYCARALKLNRIPLLVRGVHEDWYRSHIGGRKDLKLLEKRLLEVQHNHS
ncbi:MAG: hypothetical protein GY742_10150 [Hyphomicrobiales bacterium]|nr:hypothetical protein [Hyphomicrobiales bacterium]